MCSNTASQERALEYFMCGKGVELIDMVSTVKKKKVVHKMFFVVQGEKMCNVKVLSKTNFCSIVAIIYLSVVQKFIFEKETKKSKNVQVM